MIIRENRRVVRRQLRNVTLGYPSTIAGALVTLVAFCTLWKLILFCLDDTSPYRIIMHEYETGSYVIDRVEAYRDSNGGILPETLESIGFRKVYDNNYIGPFAIHGHSYMIEYVKMSDTSYMVGFCAMMVGKGQYMSSEKEWRITEYQPHDTFYYQGPDIASMYLYECDLKSTLKDLLCRLVGRQGGSQQYLLTFFPNDTQERCCFSEDSVQKKNDAVFQTFEARNYRASQLFSHLDGYTVLNGRVCFVDESPWYWSKTRGLVEYNYEKGRLFTFPKYEPCVEGDKCWFLSL